MHTQRIIVFISFLLLLGCDEKIELGKAKTNQKDIITNLLKDYNLEFQIADKKSGVWFVSTKGNAQEKVDINYLLWTHGCVSRNYFEDEIQEFKKRISFTPTSRQMYKQYLISFSQELRRLIMHIPGVWDCNVYLAPFPLGTRHFHTPIDTIHVFADVSYCSNQKEQGSLHKELLSQDVKQLLEKIFYINKVLELDSNDFKKSVRGLERYLAKFNIETDIEVIQKFLDTKKQTLHIGNFLLKKESKKIQILKFAICFRAQLLRIKFVLWLALCRFPMASQNKHRQELS